MIKHINWNKRMKDLRTEKGKTQQEMASAIGIALRTYQNVEYGQNRLTVDVLYEFLRALNISPAYFFRMAEADSGFNAAETELQESNEKLETMKGTFEESREILIALSQSRMEFINNVSEINLQYQKLMDNIQKIFTITKPEEK